MKKILIALLGIIIVGGLGFGVWYFLQQKTSGNFHQMLSVADTSEITFTLEDNKTYKKTVQYQPEVWLLTGTITDKAVPSNLQCDFSGTVQFFSEGKPLFAQPAAINLDPECQQIAFLYNGKVYHKRFLTEGLDYLKELRAELQNAK